MRDIKNHLYEQVARIGKALSSPKRLELLELLCQAKKQSRCSPHRPRSA
jgi:DNA-binding transcriptional ArsR family regulator